MDSAAIERVTKALAIAHFFGPDADNDMQRHRRSEFYDQNKVYFREESYTRDKGEGGVEWVPGKDHFRMLAKVAIDAINQQLLMEPK